MRSLQHKLLLVTLSTVFLVALFAGASAVWITYVDHRDRAREKLDSALALLVKELSASARALDTTLEAEASTPEVRRMVTALHNLTAQGEQAATQELAYTLRIRLIQHLRQTLQTQPGDLAALWEDGRLSAIGRQHQILLLKEEGNGLSVFTPRDDAGLVRFSDELWRKAPAEQSLMAEMSSPPQIGATAVRREQQLYLQDAQPVRIQVEDPDNAYQLKTLPGAVIQYRRPIDNQRLHRFFERTHVEIEILTEDGVALVSSHPQHAASRQAIFAALSRHNRAAMQSVTRADVSYLARFSSYSLIEGAPLTLAAYIPHAQVIAQTGHILWLQGAGLGIGLLITVLVTLWLGRFITQPIIRMTERMRAVANTQDLSKRVAIESTDEIGELARSFNEMTERLQQADFAMRLAEQKYRSIFENSVEGIFQISSSGVLITANPALAQMLGYGAPRNLIASEDWMKRVFPRQSERKRLMLRLMRNHAIINYDITLRRRDGSTFAAMVNAYPVVTSGKGRLIEGAVQDMTERRQQERAEQARHAAEQANAAKTQFLAAMSHEIRTPMNVIMGISELLLEQESDAAKRDYLATSVSAGEGLLSLINDILDLSKIEAGEMTLGQEPFELNALMADVTRIFQQKATQKGLELSAVCDVGPAPWRLGDASRLRQVLINLVGNAIKFTQKGSVRLRGAPLSPTHYGFEVADSGIGVAPKHQQSIFQPFSQADSGISRQYGGTGLGLSICKRLIERMEGEITLESAPGRGSLFRVELPLPPTSAPTTAAHEAQTDEQTPAANGLKILIAEDSEDNIMLLKAYLSKTPHSLTFARNGEEAVKQYALRRFDLVLMDVQMPRMDGYAATRHIRQWERRNGRARAPIWALSAHAFDDAHRHSEEAGCDGHLTKPIRKKELLAFLERFHSAQHAADDAPEPPASQPSVFP
ncbi:hybrid sensor histidine kinase/response regulator [Magnetofaba australis]|uniref:histidine kinase n=1 Tax=Magnetofaba australis IT-1 TaxID=1434232 RepID=A0A1Y2K5D1_9PROT|nr:ATP-binding protein [Magnetofaba australis]OSM02205.1 putative multi-sensor hybrid histidine kinase [Magnetofaba australis IT-1]